MQAIKFHPFPQLTTERLLLRQLSTEDVNEIFLLRTDDIVNRHLGRQKAQSLNDAKDFIQKINQLIANDESIFWSICFLNDNKLIGTVCLWNFSLEESKAEIGYELLPQYHGKGIMQEAVEAVIRYGFEDLLLEKIEACTIEENISSIKLLERNQFQRDLSAESKIDKSKEPPGFVIYSRLKN